MRQFALVVTAATLALTALPASAQMRTTAPKAPAATSGALAETGVRPTSIGGAERAQTLAPGSLLWNMGSLGFQYGLMENLELDLNGSWNPGLTILPGFALTGGLNAGIGAKYLFLKGDALSIAVDGGIDLGVNGGTFTSTFNVGLPISFWMGSKSAFHVVPRIGVNGGTSTVGTNLAYEQELNDKWRLYIGDNLRVTSNNEILNNLGAGVRVGFTPNLTVDVGVATGNLDINRMAGANRELGLGAQATLLNFGATFGTKSIDELRGLFGI